jgi:hypothetical protein
LRRARAITCLGLGLGLVTVAMPARADDDDTTTGILAGLGITAASGGTTLGEGAGAIEAGLLDTEAFQHAGRLIADVVRSLNPGAAAQGQAPRPVLILASDERLDLTMPGVIRDRMDGLARLAEQGCPPGAAGGRVKLDELVAALNTLRAADRAFLGIGRFQASDLVTIGTTQTAIGGITLTATDRMLVNAVLMNAGGPGRLASHYRLLGEPVAYDADAPTIKAYREFLGRIDALRGRCTDAGGKKAIEVADAFANSLTAGSDKGPPPLTMAAQIDAITREQILILRVAIERIGGTSLTRSGLLYTFGWPNAATVSAGLKVSFRVVDPAWVGSREPNLRAVGEVRCLVRPTNIKKVADVLNGWPRRRSITQPHGADRTVCDHRVSTMQENPPGPADAAPPRRL